jgi:transcriptional regulator of arginine metabolism
MLNGEKRKRQSEIERLVRDYTLYDQKNIESKLRESGFIVTQTTLSRDLKELGISKIGGKYSVGEQAKKIALREHIRELFSQGRGRGFDEDYEILQYRTEPAYAPAICTSIERLYEKEGVGAISGITGTILITVPTDKKRIKDDLEKIFKEE